MQSEIIFLKNVFRSLAKEIGDKLSLDNEENNILLFKILSVYFKCLF